MPPEVIIALFIVIFLINAVGFIFWIWILVDCAKNEPSEGNDKLIWILVIALAGWIGGLIYFFARRPARVRECGR